MADALFDFMGTGDRTILYSTHNLAELRRLIDDLVFLAEGQVTSRVKKDDLLERWRTISFQYDGACDDLPALVRHEQDGRRHLITSSDHQRSLDRLRSLGAAQIEATPLSLEDITVHILKGGHDGAPAAG